jgi:predicted Zn-dependent peptidase
MGLRPPNLSARVSESKFPANIFRFANGLTVIHQHLPATPVVAVDVWVKAGTSVEPTEWSGMSHFLEHMVFKGTKNILAGEFDYIIENTGGFTNAATSHDYVHFFLTTAAQYLPDTLPYLGEILLQAAIPDQEFYREREVVLEEIRASYDDPDWIAFQALSETIYQNHPYRRSILGEEPLLLQHTPNQMRCFHKTHYQPEKMAVVLVGGIEQERAISLVNQAFSNFTVRSECPPPPADAEPPLIGVRRTELYLPRLEQSRLLMGWIGPGVENLEAAITLDILSTILASGRTSRLVRQLREEKHLVLDISSSFSLQQDSSLFTISAWLNSKHLSAVEYLIREAIYEIQASPVSERELMSCKRALCNDYIFSTETPGQLAGLYGYYQTIATAELSTQYPHLVSSLSAEALQRYASQYLSSEHYAITLLQPCN